MTSAPKLYLFFWLTFYTLLPACGASPSARNDDTLYSDASAPGLVPPTDAGEGDILDQMEKLSPGKSAKMGNRVVSVESSYHAASGRECRIVAISSDSGDTSRRVICQINNSWSYAPDVYPATPTPTPQ